MVGRWFFMIIGTFFSVTPAFVYWYAGLQIIGGNASLTIGDIVAFTTLQSRLFFPLGQMLNVQVEIQGAFALFDRIFEYLDLPVEIADRENAISLDPKRVQGMSPSDTFFSAIRTLPGRKAGDTSTMGLPRKNRMVSVSSPTLASLAPALKRSYNAGGSFRYRRIDTEPHHHRRRDSGAFGASAVCTGRYRLRDRTRPVGRARRSKWFRKDDYRAAGATHLRRRFRIGRHRRHRRPRPYVGKPGERHRPRHPGDISLPLDHSREHCLWTNGRHAGRDRSRRACRGDS